MGAKRVRQKRKTLLVKNRRTVELEMGQGHVWRSDKSGTVGYPLHDSAEEVKLFDRLLRQLKKEGFTVKEDTGLVTKAVPKKPATMSAAEWRWANEADEILKMWAGDEYDNHKDAILDARGMLKGPLAARPTQAARAKRLEKMLAKVTRELTKMATADAAIAEYAKGLISLMTRRKTR